MMGYIQCSSWEEWSKIVDSSSKSKWLFFSRVSPLGIRGVEPCAPFRWRHLTGRDAEDFSASVRSLNVLDVTLNLNYPDLIFEGWG